MIATTVTIFVNPGFEEKFIRETIKNYNNTRKEPGNIRFDFLRSKKDPSRFLLYEVFVDEVAVLAHKETLHYRKWKETVEPWMAIPREGVPHDIVCPENKDLW